MAVPIAQTNSEDALAKVAGDSSNVGATSPVNPVSMDPVECERRYQRQVNSHGGDERMAKAKGRMNAVGTPMDDFINSHARGLSCQRMIACTFFGNDSRGRDTHLACNPASAAGCNRCAPRLSTICCHICTPDAFTQYTVPFVKPKRAPQKSSIKKFAMNADAHNFHSALIQWRLANATATLGEDIVHALGAKAFMTDDIVVRIVACAALGKLATPELLDKEISWDIDWAAQYKVSLLGVIHHHFPPTVSPKEPVSTAASGPPLRPAHAVSGVSEPMQW
ncbi:hypothetical protein EYR40_007130 [Pleurotus pulmonarius]|nr:hypothetical protein EYR36_003596 [Pleurotus pulmonarius]KAF4600024.1 hypothetical protein EYR40_007130 [Pleurotus pulmonarius]